MRQRADQVPARGRFRGALASLVTPLTLAAAIGALGWLGTPLARRPVPEPAPVELWIEPELLAAEPLLVNLYAPESYRRDVSDRNRTAYELEWLEQGRSFHYFAYRKRPPQMGRSAAAAGA